MTNKCYYGKASHPVLGKTRVTSTESVNLDIWDFFYEQISNGQFSAEVRNFWVDDSILLVEEFGNQSVMSEGQLSDDHIALTLLGAEKDTGVFCGKPYGTDQFAFLSRGAGFEIYTNQPLNMFTVTLNLNDPNFGDIEDAARLVGCGSKRRCDVICDRKLGTALRALQRDLHDALGFRPDIVESQSFRAQLKDQIIFSIGSQLGPALIESRTGKQTPASAWMMSEVRRLILGDVDGELSLTEICKKLKISHRTLHKNIHDHIGVGPLAFCRYVRLNAARNDILHLGRGRAGPSIAEIAEKRGFWHLPRFAGYYRQVFGELPSETLKRSKSWSSRAQSECLA